MSTIRVAVVNWTRLDDVEVGRGIDAMQEQLDDDFGPVWHVTAELKLIPSVVDAHWPGYWGLILLEKDGEGAQTVEDYTRTRYTSDGHPRALVILDKDSVPRWTHRASHVLLEMLVDPD